MSTIGEPARHDSKAEETAELLGRIAREPDGPHREKIIEYFLHRHAPEIAAVARRQVRAYRMSPQQYFDDVHSLALETALMSVRGTTESSPPIFNWGGYLAAQLRSRMRIMMESVANTGISGATTAMRKHRAMTRQMQALREQLGREPERTEIDRMVASYNDELRSTRADADRQSALLSAEDAHRVHSVSLDPDHDQPAVLAVDEAEILAFEMRAVILRTIELAHEISDDLGRIAHTLYVRYMADGESEMLTHAEVTEITALNREKVRRGIIAIRELSRNVLETEFGILRHAPFRPGPQSPDDDDDDGSAGAPALVPA